MTTTKRSRKIHSEEFKREAVELVKSQGYSRAEAGRSLDIAPNMIGRWIREFEEKDSGERLNSDEREELKRLRRENRELQMEKEILKKASAYFAKEMK